MPPLVLLFHLMLPKKTQGGASRSSPSLLLHVIANAMEKNTKGALWATPSFSLYNKCCEKKTHKRPLRPLFFYLLQLVLWKQNLRGGHHPTFSCCNQCYKKKMRGPLRLPFPLVIIIVARKTHARRNATFVCYKWRGTQCHIFMLLLWTKNSRGTQCPPPPFCCWVCNKKHAHI